MNRAQYRVLHHRRLTAAQVVADDVADMLIDEGVGDVMCYGSLTWEDRVVVKVMTARPGLVQLLRSYDFPRVEDRGVCTIAWT